MTPKNIVIACDHGGLALKNHLVTYLQQQGYQVMDMGTSGEESVDYPDFGQKAAHALLNGVADTGIVICGSGIGISIAANRFKGIRCALCTSPVMAELARQHNNANMLALGGRMTPPETAEKIVAAFLDTPFEGGRHTSRIHKIDAC